MRKIRVYADTSVFGGTQDEEFTQPSRCFFERVQRGEFVVILSTVTLRELVKSPDAVQAVWQSLPVESVEVVTIDADVEALIRKTESKLASKKKSLGSGFVNSVLIENVI